MEKGQDGQCGVKFHIRRPRREGSHFVPKRKEAAATVLNLVEPKAASQQHTKNPSPYLCTWPATAARGTRFSTVTLKGGGDSGTRYLYPMLTLHQGRSATLPWLWP